MKALEFPAKELRTQVIIAHLNEINVYDGIVIFGCGNAAKELRDQSLMPLVDMSSTGDATPNHWWAPEEVKRSWPRYFDATCGMLPSFLMKRVAESYREYFKDTPPKNKSVATGSGETVVCLSMAFPETKFTAVYDVSDASKYHAEAPLNPLVTALCTIDTH